ncbi:hypothetical protein Aperf_G00000050975 [Anoplocephala perfoliata]
MSEAMDWTYAICELLDKQGVDLRNEMDERLLEMEEQYRREREEIDRRFAEQRKEYEGQIQELQEKVEQQSMLSSLVQEESVSEDEIDTVWSDREFQLARWAFQCWKHCRFTTRRDILWNNAVLLKEANVMSVELGKKMQYQFVMLSDTPYTPLKDSLTETRRFLRNDSNNLTRYMRNHSDLIDPLSNRGLVAVEAFNTSSGHRYTWSLQTFHQRLIEMQKYFHAEGDLSTCNPNRISPTNKASVSSTFFKSSSDTAKNEDSDIETMESDEQDEHEESEEDEEEYAATSDPFYDKISWFQPIGRCLVYLTNLYFDLSHEVQLPLISRSGEQVGHLRVLIESRNDSSPPRSPAPSPLFGPASQGGRRKGHIRLHFDDLEYFTAETNGDPRSDDIAFGRFEHRQIVDPLATVRPIEENNPKAHEGRFFPADSTTSESDVITEECSRRPWLNEEYLPDHLHIGETFWFKVTILGIRVSSPNFTSVFCQFSLPDRPDEIYSTEPVENPKNKDSLDICQIQKFTVTVTRAFIDSMMRKPLTFEVFGHVRRSTVQKHLKAESSLIRARSNLSLRKGLPATLLLSPPVPIRNCDLTNSTYPDSLIYQNDLLVWFEIMELNSAGEYVSVPVQRSSDSPGQGVFMLHQGVQRRFAVTIIHESGINGSPSPPIEFVDSPKVVVGRARDTPEFHFSDAETRILSLSVFPIHYLPAAGDDRMFFRFEAAWDSSMHGCGFLNRVTPKGHNVYVTMSCYVQLNCCLDPICITKDFAMVIFPRSSTITVPR